MYPDKNEETVAAKKNAGKVGGRAIIAAAGLAAAFYSLKRRTALAAA